MRIGFIAWGMTQMNIVTQDCKLRLDSAGFEVRGLFSRGLFCCCSCPLIISFVFLFCSNFLEIVRRKAPGEVFGVDVSMFRC